MEFEQIALFIDEYSGDEQSEYTKVCSKCSNALPFTAYGPANGAGYLRAECRRCINELTRTRNELRSVHGMPPSGYQCPLCFCEEKDAVGKGGNAGPWVLDHDHERGEFRGWLCHSCNRALGAFNDNIPRLKRAIKYIRGEL